MGKVFNQYKIYYDNLSESKVGNAIALKESCNTHLNAIKGKFNQITNTTWKEKGKFSVSNIFNQINNNISSLTAFINDNLLVVCQKADQVYLKTVAIKECEENLEAKKEFLSELEFQISGLNSALDREKKKTESTNIGILQSQIEGVRGAIEKVSSEVNSLQSTLETLAEEARLLISEILMLDGADAEVINGTIEDINRYLGKTNDIYGISFTPEENHLFMGPPYIPYERRGIAFLVTFANGKLFTAYKQMDGGGYNGKGDGNPWRKYIGEKGIAAIVDEKGDNINPLGGGCSIFCVASALSYLLDIPYLDPVIPLSGGGMWGGAIRVLDGRADFEIVDTDGKLMNANITSDYIIKDYMGDSPYTDILIESSQEFKDDINSAFEAGGCVIFNTNAKGFSGESGHMLTLIGVDENGYVIMADSMYDGRNQNKLNSVNYDPDLPYSVDNCPPYMKFNKETGEPFKVDDLVDFLMSNSTGTKTYCAVYSAELNYNYEVNTLNQ